jgi:predicted RNase H-like HicB family nuclease
MVRGYEVVIDFLNPQLGGGFVAYAPALKGCVAEGQTREAALEHVTDAIDCWLAYARILGRRIPVPAKASDSPAVLGPLNPAHRPGTLRNPTDCSPEVTETG